MESYQIYGQTLFWNNERECGLYRKNGKMGMDYCVIHMATMVNGINKTSLEKAIEGITLMRNQSEEQLNLKGTPQNTGSLFLRQRNQVSISKVRENIKNTKELSDKILDLLKNVA